MGIEKRKESEIWFKFLNNLQKESVDFWSEDVFRVFSLINRCRPEEIICDKICGIPVAIFIHSTKRGPGIGGTRRLVYQNMANFFCDGLKLSSAMTYKAIWARLPLGGGKAIIYATEEEMNKKFARGFAEFLNKINTPKARFFTGEDIGFGEDFVDLVAQHTSYITGKSENAGGLGDPSPHTAEGIFLVAKAVVEEGDIFSGTFHGKIAAVQGAGKVALSLIKMLLEAGVQVFFSENDGEPSAEKRAEAAERLGARRVSREAIYGVPCHLFVPCAIGGVINRHTIPKLSGTCKVIIGAANNILDTPEDGIDLHKKQKFYVPCYVVNRWGLEWVTQEKNGVTDSSEAKRNLSNIVTDVLNIFSISREKNIAPSEIADIISKKILNDEAESIEEAFGQLK